MRPAFWLHPVVTGFLPVHPDPEQLTAIALGDINIDNSDITVNRPVANIRFNDLILLILTSRDTILLLGDIYNMKVL
jgi:hypothetical protein